MDVQVQREGPNKLRALPTRSDTGGGTGEERRSHVRQFVIQFITLRDRRRDAIARHQLSGFPTRDPPRELTGRPWAEDGECSAFELCVAPSACDTADVDEVKEQCQDGLARDNIRCPRGFR